MNEFKSIKQWASEDRPREKLMQRGVDSLSNAELLTILINTGTQNRSALDIAKDILNRCQQNLLELGKLSLRDIVKVKGMGEKKAITLLVAMELGKRRQMASAAERLKISTSKDSFELLSPYYLNKSVEEFYVVFLNNSNKVLAVESISNGGITATVVDRRIIFKRAFEVVGVTQMILSHNHPSGNLTPSEADKKLTQMVKDAGLLLDIKLLDHVIVSGNTFYSFADNGIL